MAEDTETKEEPKVEVKPLPDLDHITPKHLSDLESKLRDEMTSLHAKDHEERAELERQLAELKEYKAEQEKAQEERDKVKESQHTMVLPPNDIPPQQPNPNPQTKGEPEHMTDSGERPRRKWKDVW